MARISFPIIVFFAAGIFFLQNSQGYDDKTTHPALTDEIVDFYNASFPDKLTAEEKELIVQGAIDEDLPPRWVNHFYDPVNNEGWKSEDLGWLSSGTLRLISRLFLNSNTEIVSSKQWAHDELLQLRYSNYGGNNTWDNALRQYAKGNKKEAYYILGHILHLLEDATVPDHTRNDTHAHEGSFISEDGGSPYEDYGKNFNRQNLMTAQDLLNAGKRPVLLPSIDDYFDELAKYSNGYFFSEDTINKKYSNPKIISEDRDYGYGNDKDDKEFALVKISFSTDAYLNKIKLYSLRGEGDVVLSSYFSRLTQEAVANGAGAIKLFHDEVQKIAAGKIQLPAEPQVSWWRAEMRSPAYGTLTIYNDVAHVANQTYVVSKEIVFAVKDTAAQAASAVAGFFGKAVSIPLSFLSASVAGIPSAQPATQPSTSQTTSQQPASSALPAPSIIALAPTPQIASVPLSAPSLLPSLPTPLSFLPSQAITTAMVAATTSSALAKEPVIATTTVTSAPYQGGGWSSGVSQNTAQTQYTTYDVVYLDTASSTETSTDSIATSIDDIVATSTEDVIDTATSTDPVIAEEPEIIYADPVVINEIAWMGTRAQANDEWIELYNKTNNNVDLAGWVLEGRNKTLSVHLTGIIKANSYFLLERTASTTTNQQEDMIFTGAINNDGPNASLYLKNGSTTIDFVDFGYWLAGDNTNKKTMERVSPYADGNNFYNWKTYSEASAPLFAKDAAGNNISGTPGAKNSATGWYIPAAPQIAQNTIWRKGHGPYFVPAVMTIAASSTLTIEPGAVVKFAKVERSGGGINIEGVLRAEGTEQEPIIFTSLADDATDGVDSNQDGTSTVPASGDWKNINFLNPKQPSSLKYAQVRYGGQGTNHNPNGWYPDYTGAINIQNSSPEIYRSAFASNTAAEIYIKGDSHPKITQNHIGYTITPSGQASYLGGVGIRLVDVSSTADIIGNLFENNTVAIASRSATTTSLVVRDNNFRGNSKNSEFYSAEWLNLDNSGNHDLDSKGGFHIAFHIAKGESVNLKSDDMPYIFDGGEFITVDEGGALTIEPGTVLKNREVTHTIRGTLTARGTPENPIIFTALADDSDGYDSNFATTTPQDGAWKNIQFIGASSSDSVLENVVLKYGGEGTNYNPNGWYPTYTGAVNIQNSSPRIANVTVENSRAIALNVKGQARPIIKNSVVKNTITPTGYSGAPNYNYGLYLADAVSSADITGNRFENNDTAIRSESASDAPLVVKDNIFANNNKNGVFADWQNFNLDNSNNRDQNNKGGFYISVNATRGQSKIIKADLMPYVMSWLNIEAGGELSVEPGVVLKMSNGKSLSVKGVLHASGTPDKPIIFTSFSDDSDGYDSDNSAADPREGEWKNIQFIGASSSDSVLERVKIKYGGSGVNTCPYAYLGGPCMAYEGAVLIDGSSPIINSAVLDRNLAIALYIKGAASPTISNSTISNTKEAMSVPGAVIGGYGISIGAESSPTLTNNTYSGNAKDVVYR